MKTRYQVLILIITIFIVWKLGYWTGKQDFLNTQRERVFNLYGEGDLGEQINYYLQTGDTSLENY